MLLPCAVRWQVCVCVWTEVTQANEWLATGVLDRNPTRRSVVRDKDFVFGVLTEANHRWSLQSQLTDPSLALHGDPTACCTIFEGRFCTWINRQFLRTEQLLSIDSAVYNPLIGYTCRALIGIDYGFDVVRVFEMGIDVLFPIKLPDDEVQVLVLVLWHVLDEQ